MINKKGYLDSGLIWVPAMLVMALILIFHMLMTFIVFSDNAVFGNVDTNVVLSNEDFVRNDEFLEFLGTEIIVEGEIIRIVDAVFEIHAPFWEGSNERNRVRDEEIIQDVLRELKRFCDKDLGDNSILENSNKYVFEVPGGEFIDDQFIEATNEVDPLFSTLDLIHGGDLFTHAHVLDSRKYELKLWINWRCADE